MSKIRVLNDLQDVLDNEFSWRLKELANFKILVRSNQGASQKTAIRSAICLSYAHWEGFIKRTAEHYINFVSNQRLRYDELSDCFVVIGAKKYVSEFAINGSSSAAVAAVTFLRSQLNERAHLRLPGHVKTKSNLNSDVFEQIAVSIGISTDKFVTRYKQIDEEILKRRNGIAHGEFLNLDKEPCIALVEDVIKLLRQFKEEIEQAASNYRYLC